MIFRNFRRPDRPLCDPGEARTLDPLIKSQLLYQLSYGVIVYLQFLPISIGFEALFSQLRCKGKENFAFNKIFSDFFAIFCAGKFR